MARRGVALSRSTRALRRLRGAHAGQRAFIVGNGPSLTVADLNRLGDEITFASNKIYLSFDQTDWRPTYYNVADIVVAQNNAEAIASIRSLRFLAASLRRHLPEDERTIWVHERATTPETLAAGTAFSGDCLRGMHGGWSVVYHQIQLAWHMGIRDVLLIGVDFRFQGGTETTETGIHGRVLRSEGERNHFHPQYRRPGERWTAPQLDLQRMAYACARRWFDTHGASLRNASRRTDLDVIEQVETDRALAERACP